MKNRWLSMLLLFSLCLGFVSGCKEDESSVNPLELDGNDVVLKIGKDEYYTADELFGDMLDSELGAELVYERILKMVVENTLDVDSHLKDSWDVQYGKFEDEVKSYKNSNGVSEDEAEKAVLKEKGYDSVEEWQDEYYFENRLTQLQKDYWEEVYYDKYYLPYLEERLPYYVKHALVKTAYTDESGTYSSQISEADAQALFDVYEMLKKNEKFSYIINHLSEDTGSSSTGKGYHMDLTTSFVKEFLRGVFVFDSLRKDKTNKVVGIDAVLDFFASESTGYGFNTIKASDLELLGKYASSTSYQGITTYKNEKEEGSTEEKEVSSSTITSDYGSSSSLYTRSIIFNQIFNNPGISVIEYDLKEEAPENTTTIVINGEEKVVLTDENDNIVFIACARGDSGDLWIHFLTVNVSPFDENIELFYSLNQKETIDRLVAAETKRLNDLGTMDAAAITEAIKEYRTSLESVRTYVDIVGGEKPSERNKVIKELEETLKTYAKRGVTSGIVPGEEQYLTYDMIEYYMENKIEIVNTNVKKTLEDYIDAQRKLIDYKSFQSIVDGWEEYGDLLDVLSSDDVTSRKIPFECSYAVNGQYRSSTSTTLCKYNYETGFEIMMTYTTNGGDYAVDGEANVIEYTKSFHLGTDDVIILPTLTRTGYKLEGWYYTEKFEEDTKIKTKEVVIDGKTVVIADFDLSESSKDNKTQLFAHWVEDTSVGGGE